VNTAPVPGQVRHAQISRQSKIYADIELDTRFREARTLQENGTYV